MTALEVLGGWPVPAAAAAVIGPAGVLATHGDTARVFALASVTKPLVARAAQVAVEEGVVNLDTPAGPPGSTVRHLLAHTSGLAMHSDQALARPGTRRMYSNYGFTVLAESVQRESGIEFGRYLTEAVCEHLGMVTTRLDRAPLPPGSGRPRRSRTWRCSRVICCVHRRSRRRCMPTRPRCSFPAWTVYCPGTVCSGPMTGAGL